MTKKNNWQPAETAPKYKLFIGDFGFPSPLIAIWSQPSKKFVTANLQADMYYGKYNDFYFENEYMPESELKRWQPLPDTQEIKK